MEHIREFFLTKKNNNMFVLEKPEHLKVLGKPYLTGIISLGSFKLQHFLSLIVLGTAGWVETQECGEGARPDYQKPPNDFQPSSKGKGKVWLLRETRINATTFK